MKEIPCKDALRRQIIQLLKSDLELQTKAAQLAHDEAISEESRPENKYDTHSQEAAYLAEGQAKLASDLAESVTLYEALPLPDFAGDTPIAVGALVQLTARNQSVWYFLGPRAGGLEVKLENGEAAFLITPQSPLGRQLLGRKAGDTVQLPGRGAAHTIGRVF